MSLTRKSITALMWAYVGVAVKAGAQLVIQISLARLLGPQSFGEYSALMIFVTIGWLVADFGFGAALVQRKTVTDDDIGLAVGAVLVLGSLVAAALFLSSAVIGRMFNNMHLVPMLKTASVLIWLQALSNISMSLLRRNLDMRRYQLIQQGTYVMGFGGVSLCLAIYGAGAWSLLGGYASQVILCLVLGYAATRHPLRPRFWGDITLIHFGLKVAVTNMVNWVVENVDRLLVGRLWGIAPLGMYTVSLNLTRAPVSMVASAVQSVAFAATSRGQDDVDTTRIAYRLMIVILSCVLLPAFCCIAFNSDLTIRIVYGASWSDAAPYLTAFAFASPFVALAAVTGSMLWGIGRVGGELRAQICVAIALVGLFVLASGQPLSLAVWVIPTIYVLRFTLLARAFCTATSMQPWRVLGALSPAIVISCCALMIAAAVRFSPLPGSPELREAMSLIASFLTIAVVTRLALPRLIDKEVHGLIESLMEHSKIIRLMARLTGLEKKHRRIT